MKAGMSSSLAQVKTSVQMSLRAADTLVMDPRCSRVIASLSQVKTDWAPTGDGELHSGCIVETLEKLQKIKGRKTQLDQMMDATLKVTSCLLWFSPGGVITGVRLGSELPEVVSWCRKVAESSPGHLGRTCALGSFHAGQSMI